MKQTSTASRLIFAHSLLPPQPPSSPLPLPLPPPASRVNPETNPSPLLRDVGSFNTPSAPSQARLQPNLPLPFPKGCGRVSFARQRIRGGKKTGKPIQRQRLKQQRRRRANPEDDTTMRRRSRGETEEGCGKGRDDDDDEEEEGGHSDDEGGRDEEENRCPTGM